MGGQEDFVSSLKAIMAAKRKELGEPPTPEELLAYRDGLLDPAERERMEARIAVHPDAARALADLAAFPAVEPAPGTPELTDEDIDARWQAFRQRASSLARPEAPKRGPGPAPAPPAVPLPRNTEPGPRRSLPPRLAAAAVVALAVGSAGGFLAGRASRNLPDSAVNVSITELTPLEEGGIRSAAPSVEMPEGSEELLLILGAPEAADFPEYEAEIVDRSGVPVWSREGLRPQALGTFRLSFRRGFLGPGTYRVHLFGRDAERRTRVATYELQLSEESKSR